MKNEFRNETFFFGKVIQKYFYNTRRENEEGKM